MNSAARRWWATAVTSLFLASCSGGSGEEGLVLRGSTTIPTTTAVAEPVVVPSTSIAAIAAPSPTVPAEVTAEVQAAADEPVAPEDPPPAPDPTPRTVHEQAWTPFASAGGVTLHHPSSRVELIGFHESNLDGARQLDPLSTAAPTVTLEARERDTGSRTAADVVVDPETEIRAPVTGTVLHASSYILYCRHTDNFLIVEPDDHPGWEVKLLHFEGLAVGPGDRVVAGETVVGSNARQLPFQSQVDKVAAQPAWPHVHVEIDDPTIPDRPGDGGC